MLEILLTVLMYSILLAEVAAVALILSGLASTALRSEKKSPAVFIVSLMVELSVLIILAIHPIMTCPEQLKPYLTEEKKQSVIGFNNGLYSGQIPFIPVCVHVKEANEDEILVETSYSPFGHTEMAVSENDPDFRRGIFGVS